MTEGIRIFRCSSCGKWSHAKKKPSKHQRWIDDTDPRYDHSKNEGGYGAPDGHGIDCGPFVAYIATPEATS